MGKKAGAGARVAGRPLWSIGAQGLLSLALVLLFLRLLQLRLDSVAPGPAAIPRRWGVPLIPKKGRR
ncbi:hypothetical protein FAZ78_16855 [Cereibacter changlensis]|uniref:Uncharacterized protein n=1 Tax=Cereibacter changlensis TaxID=402884 RepID=A0A4U0YS77_9RHOB|nr:hypothetical protein [Cereibacter changlensis]TKA95442.1 hypothetical protein FAZ78_16855 [Cereibacter changlensis]